ncbi:MAG: hypothetical protein H8E26_08750 [FCB group bacterium]|nr:hypothetical protein [FCB group bacterium]MBL7028920.1 hypothetical protein [Candidatus Neomarinimicrobiota bacterium]MBL7122758.1 hypothetical protein [Candidatus Neomarinimicrobiota bacterium]
MNQYIIVYVMGIMLLSCAPQASFNDPHVAKPEESTHHQLHLDAPPETALLGQLFGSWDAYLVSMNRDGSWSSDTTNYQWQWYPILDGHAIQDDWIKLEEGEDSVPDSKVMGTNLRIFNAPEQQWHMVWIDRTQRKSQVYTAVNSDSSVIMSGENAMGRPVRNTFFNINPDHFDWKQEWTFDNGTSWVVVSKIQCKRKD